MYEYVGLAQSDTVAAAAAAAIAAAAAAICLNSNKPQQCRELEVEFQS